MSTKVIQCPAAETQTYNFIYHVKATNYTFGKLIHCEHNQCIATYNSCGKQPEIYIIMIAVHICRSWLALTILPQVITLKCSKLYTELY